jgi:hypothetical protein
MKFVMIHDRRVPGGIPARPDLGIINTDEMTRLHFVFARIHRSARQAPIHTMYILAHGTGGIDAKPAQDEVHSYMRPGGVCLDAGGMGVKLAAEGIRHYNVQMWREIRGRVGYIVLFSCAAADTQPGNKGTVADGQYLMGALAIHTGATVYASNRIQYYSRWHNLAHGRFQHPAWQGTLFEFSPTNGSGKRVKANRAPVEFAQVMGEHR